MNSDRFQVSISSEMMPFISQVQSGETPDEKVTLCLAIGLFLSKQASLAKSAELAQKGIWEFIEILRAQGIPWGELSEESLALDGIVLSKLANSK